MSNHHINWVWEHSDTTGNARIVMLVLADSANKDSGEVWLGVNTIASMARVNERTVRRVLKELLSSGEIELLRAHSQHRPATYRMTMQAARQTGQNVHPELSRQTGQNVHPEDEPADAQTGHHVQPDRTPRAARPDTAMSTEPLEPLKEPLSKPTARTRASSTRKATAKKAPGKKSPAVSKVPKRTRLDPTWVPPADIHEQMNFTNAQAAAILAEFRDYWVGHGKLMADWTATWRNWLRRSRERTGRAFGAAGRDQRHRDLIAEVAAEEAAAGRANASHLTLIAEVAR